jgi:CBS domain-containing protein
MKVLTPQDTLKEALFIMTQAKVTTVFIVDPQNGQAVGMLTLKDICTHLVFSEAKDKIKWQSIQNTGGGNNNNTTKPR